MMIKKLVSLVLFAGLYVFALSACQKGEGHDGTNGKTTAVNGDSTAVHKNADGKGQDNSKEEELIPVETTVAVAGDISSYILLSSNLETERMTDVYGRVQGLVEGIYAQEGDYVRKGQVLLKLEPEEYALEEARARVDYEQEQNLYERKKSMFDKNLLSKEEFETSGFSVQAKEILWQQARLNLNFTKIESPISGVVGERMVRQGDRVQPSDKLFTVINSDEMIAVVHVPEMEIGAIRKDQVAYITSRHLQDEQFSGWIKRVSPVVDPQSGTFKVTIGIKNENNRLRPGMFVNAHIIIDTHQNTVLIPKTALLYENEQMHVLVVRDSVAHKIKLNAGYQDYEKVEALAGIAHGEKIVVVGQAGLKDQTRVKIVAERENTLNVVASRGS
jgi:RND family efflux transporter MFP subunit